LGNSAKARAQLGWQHKVSFRELVREMVEADLKLIFERSDGSLRIDRPQMAALFKNEALVGRVYQTAANIVVRSGTQFLASQECGWRRN
jgi:hypothetical protein